MQNSQKKKDVVIREIVDLNSKRNHIFTSNQLTQLNIKQFFASTRWWL